MTILEVVKNPRTIVTACFLLLAFALLSFGERIGLGGSRQWIALALLALLFGLAQGLISLLGRKKQTEDLETSLIIEADKAVTDSSDEEKELRKAARAELLATIAHLKKSTVAGGLTGSAALSALPWYLVLGPQDAGKGETICHSGLQLPGTSTEALSGISSSTNCDWWFTNQAIILEAHHRFTGDDPTVERDWDTFLELLRKARAGIPLNGVIVTLPADLILRKETDINAIVVGIRQRLDRIPTVLHVHCPVYLMVTKTDLVPGFSEFFADLDTAPRNQIFGCTIPVREMHPKDPVSVFRREFDLLFNEVFNRRLTRLVQERDPARRQLIYGFPVEFQGLRDKVGRIVAQLYRPTPLGVTPGFRGVYFSCGADPSVSRKAHFLKGFFLKALIPDFRLARSTSAALSRQKIQRLVLQGAACAALGVFALLLIISFSRNQNLLTSTREMTEAASHVVAPSGDLPDVTRALDMLERLRLRLESLEKTDRMRPPTLGMGMYRGNVLTGAARDIYLHRLVEVLLEPSRAKFVEHLKGLKPSTPEEISQYMDEYRAYRMLVNPEYGDPDQLVTRLIALWSDDDRNPDATQQSRDLITGHIQFAWFFPLEVADLSSTLPPLDQDLVRQASRIIRASWKPERYYENLIADINSQTEPYNLAGISRASDLLTVVPPKSNSVDFVPGAFTLEGWTTTVRDRIAGSEIRLREDWILRDVFKDQEITIMGWLMRKYTEDYIDVWTRFLGAVDLVPTKNIADTGRQIWDLAGSDSALMSLLTDAHENLEFSDDDIGSEDEWLLLLKEVEPAFAALHALFEKQDDARPIDTYLADLQKIAGEMDTLQDADKVSSAAAEFTLAVFKDPNKDASAIRGSLVTARRHAGRFQTDAQKPSSAALRTLLGRPAQAAWRACLAATGSHLNSSWKENVSVAFDRTLKGRYPFSSKGSDASIEDATNFFGPEGTFWRFVDQQLAPYLGAKWQPDQIYGYGLSVPRATRNALTRADLFRKTLFTGEGGAAKVLYSIEAAQVASPAGTNYHVTESMLEIGSARLDYDMGRIRSVEFQWPDPRGSVPARVAVDIEGRAPEPLSVDESSWVIFKLLDQASVEKETDRRYRVVWTLRRPGEYELPVPFKLHAKTAVNPFGKGFFNFTCPTKVAN